MKTLAFALMAVASTSALAQSECTAIKQDKARLACFDKKAATSPATAAEVPKPPAPPVPPALQKMPTGTVFTSQSWSVHQSKDPMTDKKSCTALYKGEWKVQGTENTLYVNFKGRGGVKAYTLRVDEEPADSMVLASEMEKSISAADLKPSFARIYNGSRVRLQVITIIGSILNEDIDLHGFKESIDYLRQNCNA